MRVLQDLRTRLAHSLSSMHEHLHLGSDVVKLSIPYSLVNKQRSHPPSFASVPPPNQSGLEVIDHREQNKVV
jgi:hypothetical protein